MDDIAKHFIEDEPRTHIGDVLGVDVAITRGWWLQPLGMLIGGQLLARKFGSTKHRWRSGIGFSGILAATGAVHAVGHIISARLVEAPMDTLLVTPMRTFTLYDDAGDPVTRDQDVGRAIGGPVANLAAGLSALVLSFVVKNRYLRFFGIASLCIGLASLIPVAGNDGVELFAPEKE